MLNATRHKYDAYTQQIGKLNTVADPIRSFEVLPAIAQTLREKLKGSSDSLSKINIIPVVAQEGDKVGVGLKGTIARRSTPGRTSPISRHCCATRSSAPRRARAMQTRLLQHQAWAGHTTDSEGARYTAAADQRTLSDTAADKLLANLAESLAKDAAKALKIKEDK